MRIPLYNDGGGDDFDNKEEDDHDGDDDEDYWCFIALGHTLKNQNNSYNCII